MRTRTALSLLILPLAACTADPADLITADGIRRDVMALSADSMEGRAPGTAGDQRAVRYISARFESMGLEPAGESYALPVELLGMQKDAARSTLTIRGPQGRLAFRDNETLTWWSAAGREVVDLMNVPILFVGYGVEAPEYQWDDFKGAALAGKVLLFLNNDPPVTEDGRELFGGEARTYYGRWTYKFEQAQRHGAAGAIVIHTTASASYPFSVIGNTGARENWARDYKVDLLGWIDSTSSERIAAGMGTNLSGLFAMAARRDFRPRDTRLQLSAHIETTIRRVETYNVAGVIRGADPALRDQYLVFSAHYDHLGTNPAGGGDDQLYNGAWDNAAGTAAIISLGRAFVAARPARSVMLVAVGGEEGGLLGSGAFVTSPPVPLKQIVANFNVDMPQIFGVTDDVAAIGLDVSTLGTTFAEVAREHGLATAGDPNPAAGSFYRSDQISFAKVGIPALYPQPGSTYRRPLAFDPVAYEDQHYHQPSDEVRSEWDLSGLERDMRILFLSALRVANAPDQPRWTAGHEFEEEWKALYGKQ